MERLHGRTIKALAKHFGAPGSIPSTGCRESEPGCKIFAPVLMLPYGGFRPWLQRILQRQLHDARHPCVSHEMCSWHLARAIWEWCARWHPARVSRGWHTSWSRLCNRRCSRHFARASHGRRSSCSRRCSRHLARHLSVIPTANSALFRAVGVDAWRNETVHLFRLHVLTAWYSLYWSAVLWRQLGLYLTGVCTINNAKHNIKIHLDVFHFCTCVTYSTFLVFMILIESLLEMNPGIKGHGKKPTEKGPQKKWPRNRKKGPRNRKKIQKLQHAYLISICKKSWHACAS